MGDEGSGWKGVKKGSLLQPALQHRVAVEGIEGPWM